MTDKKRNPKEKKLPKDRVTLSEAVFNEICTRIANGQSLRQICKLKTMPSMAAFFNWVNADAKLLEQYTRARETQAEHHADEMVLIADDLNIPPEHKRIMIDARKWKASKQAPKKFGDKQEVNHTGGLALTVNTGVPDAIPAD